MTDNHRWHTFVAMMEAAGWEWVENGFYVHPATGAGYHVDGHYYTPGATGWKRDSVRPWCEWLEAGETPPPF